MHELIPGLFSGEIPMSGSGPRQSGTFPQRFFLLSGSKNCVVLLGHIGIGL